MKIIETTQNCPHAGEIKFATYEEFEDPYSSKIRTNWAIDSEALLACALLNESETFIDLGANIGAFCMPIAVSKKCSFLAVEALPDNVKLLEHAIGMNGIKNSKVINAAILDIHTTIHVKGSSAYGTVNDSGLGIPIDSVVGDELFLDEGFESAKLVKIDIEGAELRALKGMAKFLSDEKPRSYIFEANGAHCFINGYMPSDILKQFEAHNFQTYMIVGRRLVPHTSSDLQPFGLINYLAIPNLPNNLDYDFHVSELPEKDIIRSIVRALTEMKPGYRDFMLAALNQSKSSFAEHPDVIDAIIG